MVDVNKYSGCFLGLALGDAMGAPYEGGVLERWVWKFLAKTPDGFNRYTDDTQMAMDIANTFLSQTVFDQDYLAGLFAANYRWSRGYGPAAAWLLKKIKAGARWQDVNRVKYADGSFGNGAAMRAPIIALCSPENPTQLADYVQLCSEVTHAHPLAVEGAAIIAIATACALADKPNSEILAECIAASTLSPYQLKLSACVKLLADNNEPKPNFLIKLFGNGIAAIDSCVTALYFALKYRHVDFPVMHRRIFVLGGDVDTIAAMAGAIWGAANGLSRLDKKQIARLENNQHLLELAIQLHRRIYSPA